MSISINATVRKNMAAREQINQRRAQTLTTIVAEAIEQMVITGALTAGDRINESTLAAQLNVSRGPVREACRSLEKAGLLVSRVNRGVFVRTVSPEEARELYEIRAALAGLTGQLAARRASDEEIIAIAGLFERMSGVVKSGDVDKYYSLNVDLHAALLNAAKNTALSQHDNLITTQLHQHRRRGLARKESMELSHEEHREIISALEKRDESLMEKIMRRHVQSGWQRLSAAL
ncbi:MAG: FCD domain-containing protein [Alphaproteobacteria bacterium]|nr:FCD domain-containing protein [Alphaproteobacteria bacterium]MDA8003300.1 FCD domain-containing protein [Alphaproteobacteria bacterium]MDA8005008.1 FCD domain-containing protein [Alphaproteobacteria bacterium]MDA8012379.1 FCD domain-containing protein [Alphaproteobacteria bacterium]